MIISYDSDADDTTRSSELQDKSTRWILSKRGFDGRTVAPSSRRIRERIRTPEVSEALFEWAPSEEVELYRARLEDVEETFRSYHRRIGSLQGEVGCPECGAEEGESCTNAGGQDRSSSHEARARRRSRMAGELNRNAREALKERLMALKKVCESMVDTFRTQAREVLKKDDIFVSFLHRNERGESSEFRVVKVQGAGPILLDTWFSESDVEEIRTQGSGSVELISSKLEGIEL